MRPDAAFLAYPDDPIDETTAIAELDRTLDALSDDHPGRADAPPRRSSPLGGTAVALRALDDARPPDPTFVAHLEEQLMSAIAVDSIPTRAAAPPSIHPRSSPAPRAVARRPVPASGYRRGLIELASFATLIALLFGQATGTGGNLAFWQDATPTPAVGPADIGMERGNAGRTGEYAADGPDANPALAWRNQSLAVVEGEGSFQFASPVLSADELFALNAYTGSLYRVAVENGSWGSQSTGAGFVESSNVAVADGTVYVATAGPLGLGGDAGYLIAVDRATLQERWRVETGGVTNSAITVEGGRLFFRTTSSVVAAYDAADGRQLWTTPIDLADDHPEGAAADMDWAGLQSPGTAAVADGAVYVSAGQRTLVSLDAATGDLRWTFRSDTPRLGNPVVRDGAVYVVARDGGEGRAADESQVIGQGALYRIDAATGAERWRWALPAWAPEASIGGGEPLYPDSMVVTVDADHAYVLDAGSLGNEFTALNVADGSVAWTTTFMQAGGSAPVVAGETLYLARQDGGIYALSTADGSQRWRLDTGRRFLMSPVVSDGRLVAMTRDGYVFGIAVVGEGATPVAAAAGTVSDPSDISGLAPCVPPRALPDPLPTGEPTLPDVVDDLNLEAINGTVAFADLPTGPAAGGDAVLGILATLREMPGCDRPGREADLAAFYSDDYLRRLGREFGPGLSASIAASRGGSWAIDLQTLPEPVALSAGRVGILILSEQGDTGAMIVFVEQDNAWLIDEIISAAEDPTIFRG